MTLVQLEYIVAVDTYRSFVIAAEKCFVTQPTLSMQINKLEITLGAKLFDRSKQPVVPTDIGIAVLEQARNILVEAGKLQEVIALHKKELAGELRIGVIPTIAPYLLPTVVSSFGAKYDKVRLSIWEYTTEEIVQKLKSGLLDCGVLSTPLEEKGLLETPLFYEDFVVYAAEGHQLLAKESICAADINASEMWLLNEGHCMRNQVLNICSQSAHAGDKRLEYNTGSVETLKRMVDINAGFTILPELSMVDFPKERLSQLRSFESPAPAREISLVTHRNFLKRAMISALQAEILDFIPERMLHREQKAIMDTMM